MRVGTLSSELRLIGVLEKAGLSSEAAIGSARFAISEVGGGHAGLLADMAEGHAARGEDVLIARLVDEARTHLRRAHRRDR